MCTKDSLVRLAHRAHIPHRRSRQRCAPGSDPDVEYRDFPELTQGVRQQLPLWRARPSVALSRDVSRKL